MTIIEGIMREIYRLVREEGYAPDLSGIQEIRFSCPGYNELRTHPEIARYLEIAKGGNKFYGVPIKMDGRQNVRFRVICKPTDD